MQVKIIEFPTTTVAALEHRGPVELLNDSVGQFIAWRKQSKLSPVTTSSTFGIAYDDPKSTPPEDFRFDICGSIADAVPQNPQGVVTKVIPGGRCAMLRHKGSHDTMDPKVYYLYGEWLPDSGELLRDFPCFFHYQNFFPEVAEHELITDIYLPLK